MQPIVIGTRGSSLSLCQTRLVQVQLEERWPGRLFSLKTIKARADQQPDVSLVAMDGEGIFVKELEAALLGKDIDLAVHSLKDLPLALPAGLALAAITDREDPRDALISRSGHALDELPKGARIGTSSPRRKSQLLHARPDLDVMEIRGNVDTRLRKLDEGRYDAIVVAACGLIRLGLEDRITDYLSLEQMLPEPGQGSLGIQARADDAEMIKIAETVNDPTSRRCVEAERAVLTALGGGCRVPIAAYAAIGTDGAMMLDGAVITTDGSRRLHERVEGDVTQAASLAQRVVDRLRAQGAADLLAHHAYE